MKKLVTILVVLAMVGTVPVASATPFSDAVNALSPVGYWQFENDWTDSTAGGNTLTPFGTATFTAGPGLVGLGAGAADFRHPGGQQGAYVLTGPGDPLTLPGATAYTVNAWVSNEEGGAWGMIAVERDSTWGGGWNYGLSQYQNPGGGNQGLRAWTGGLPEAWSTAGADSGWHMLTISVTLGSTANFYVDGVLVGSAGVGGTLMVGDGVVFVVGNNATPLTADWGPSDLNGRVDELAVFGTALTAEQIAGLYAAASTTPVTKVTVTGQVSLQDFFGTMQMVGAMVELRPSAGPAQTEYLLLDAAGAFSISEVEAGTYDVAVKTYAHLQKVLAGVTIDPDNTDLGTIELIAGDIDGDNEVTTSDLATILLNMDLVGD